MQSTTYNKTKSSKRPSRDSQDVPTVRVPLKFNECSRSDLVALISRMLSFLIDINDKSSSSSPSLKEDERHYASDIGLTRFHSRVPPNISVYNYLIRLTKYSSLEHCALLSAVYYIDLLTSVYPIFTLNSLTVHRFLLTATTVASKGLCDSFCTNSHYAKVGGVQCNELNVLETDFLRKVNYRVIPSEENIALCKLEHAKECFTIADKSRPVTPTRFDVLDNYYRHMIQLVGSFDSSPDKSRKANYVFDADPTTQDVSRKRNYPGTEHISDSISISHPTDVKRHFSESAKAELRRKPAS